MTNNMTLEQLKARGYELIMFINQAQAELAQVNQAINKEMEKPVEEPVNEDAKPMEEVKK